MAQSSSCFSEIVDNDGLSLLLNFLKIVPTSSLSPAELAACERVHQKSAIALTRLAKDAENAKEIVKSGGKLLLPVHIPGTLCSLNYYNAGVRCKQISDRGKRIGGFSLLKGCLFYSR